MRARSVGCSFHIEAPIVPGDFPHKINEIAVTRHHKPGHAILKQHKILSGVTLFALWQ
jgi:hypothetical protein